MSTLSPRVALLALWLPLACETRPASAPAPAAPVLEQRSPPAASAAPLNYTPAPPPRPPHAAAPSVDTPRRSPVPPLPDPLPGQRRDVSAFLGDAVKVAGGDLDGDGKSELVVATAAQLRVLDTAGREKASVPTPGGAQLLSVVDLDGNRRGCILVGWGMDLAHRDAAARVSVYRLERGHLVEETVLTPPTTRAEITTLLHVGGSPPTLLITHYVDKYDTRSVYAARTVEGWKIQEIARIRMASAYARGDVDGDGKPDVVVGRPYGDDRTADGDIFLLRPDGTRVPIPSLRGVRALTVADSDGDRLPEIFYADGWHMDYGRVARGQLSWARWDKGAFTREVIEDTPGQFTLFKVLAADVDGDGTPEIVTQGSAYARVFKRVGSQWKGLTVGEAGKDLAVAELDGKPGVDVVIVAEKGPRSEIISLRGTEWPR
ncbi:MAG: VCBS repeat-containing protein [Myxococcota bacterium]